MSLQSEALENDSKNLEDAILRLTRSLENFGLALRGRFAGILEVEDARTCLMQLREFAVENGLLVRQVIGSELDDLLKSQPA